MLTDLLTAWAARYGIPAAAVDGLRQMLAAVPELDDMTRSAVADKLEGYVQSQLRIAAPLAGFTLYRNNVGALKDERGVPVRYGLANDTAALNKVIKSGDLIGYRSLTIGPEHLGQRLAQFVSIECKRADWRGVSNDREKAQERWIAKVVADGGLACFSTGALPK